MSHDKQFFTTFFAIMGALAVLAIILVIIAINLTSEDAEFKPDEVVLENIIIAKRDADPATRFTTAAVRHVMLPAPPVPRSWAILPLGLRESRRAWMRW